MYIEIAIAVLILFVLTFLATVDMAFSQMSDVGLRRLSSDFEDSPKVKSVALLQEILENRPRFRFALSAAIQILVIAFSVLVTLIVSRFSLTYLYLLLVSLLISLTTAVFFRQFIPRLLTSKNPETKLLFLLPVVRPFYGILTILADPFQFFNKDNLPAEPTVVPNQTVE